MEYLFVGEALALDLVNTEVVVRGKPRDLLEEPADLLTWWQAAGARYPELGPASPSDQADRHDSALLDAARALRSALRRLFEALVAGGEVDQADLDALNRVLRTGYQALESAPDGALRAAYRTGDAGPAGRLLPIARSALNLATARDRGRLHRCDNDRCVLLFYDTTKSATRRWCSVGCMNRARSALRHRQRKERASSDRAV